MRIAHLGDIHVRLLKRHDQYRVIFEELYDRLREEKVDLIIDCGDTNHSKTNLSPESIGLISDFFRKLSRIAPLYVIPGNHDCVLHNASRQDSITPIVNSLNLPNIHYLKFSQEVAVGENITLNHLSILDKGNWKVPSDPGKISIALHHGAILNSVTDSGWKVDKSDIDLDYLRNFDYAFLADIHKSNQVLDSKGKIRYCGSLISQDFSEDFRKGFLLWDIEGKNEYTCEFVQLNNPNPFVTVEIDKKGNLVISEDIPQNSNIRVVSKYNIAYDLVNKSLDVVRARYNPESVMYFNQCVSKRGELLEEISYEIQQENLRDIAVQEKLIREYLKEFKTTEETIQSVLDLNKKYNVVFDDEEEIERNVKWKLKSSEWDNLFNYGEGNKIDFSQLKGVVGIFGKSFSGKTSAIESMLYTIFNSITKNSRKNYNIINQNKKIGRGKVEIEVGNRIYNIERSSEKYDKRLRGKETEEAKTLVNFSMFNREGEEINLNGIERTDTDKNIRRIFGTIDDFLLTSMSSQFESMAFINEGSTKRKEILAKFLDLDLFERKFKMAKEDVADLKGAIKKSGDLSSYVKQIRSMEIQIEESKGRLEEQKGKCEVLKREKEINSKEMLVLEQKNEMVSVKFIDIDSVLRNLDEILGEMSAKSEEFDRIEREIEEKEELLSKFVKFEQKIFDIEEYKAKLKEIADKRKEIDEIGRNIFSKEKEIKAYQAKAKLLKEVPCGEEHKGCKFISDAYESIALIEKTSKSIAEDKKSIEIIQAQIDKLDPDKVEEYVGKYEKVIEKKNRVAVEVLGLQTLSLKLKKTLQDLGKQKEIFDIQKSEYEKNKEQIEGREELALKIEGLKEIVSNQEKEMARCEEIVRGLYRECGSVEQQLEDMKGKRDNLAKMRAEYESYDLFLKCCSSDGIPFEIIKSRLAYVNGEIAKILSSVVKFSVFFEIEESRLNLNIKYPGFSKRSLDMASGAEKTLSSLAMRLALIKITNLPLPNFLVLDEPALSLDSNILESFGRMLDMLKENFDIIFLISHLDALKDLVDNEIVIQTKDKYAYISQ